MSVTTHHYPDGSRLWLTRVFGGSDSEASGAAVLDAHREKKAARDTDDSHVMTHVEELKDW